MFEIQEVFEIINKYGLSRKTEINKILNMAQINCISLDVVTKISIREYGGNRI